MSADSSSHSDGGEKIPTDGGGDTYRLSQPNPMGESIVTPPVFSPAPKPVDRKVAARRKQLDAWALVGFNALVFVTSVCVMMLELTASRLISKTVGSSLYTWTSVIGVVLAGITIGNWLGGWLADRYPRSRSLAWMYLLGSVSCASVLWLDQIIAPMSRPDSLSWPTWILVVVASIFLIPSLALGTISPLVASMALERSSRTGSTVGNVYAWGAFGSIVGTFLTGFYLIDVFGTRSIIGVVAGTLGLLAVIVAGSGWAFRTAVVCGWMQLLGWTVLAATCTQPMMASIGDTAGRVRSVLQTKNKSLSTRHSYSSVMGAIGRKLHELGYLAKLRDDRVDTYYDESNYSTIVVADHETEDGETIKHLRLDKLIHSYYDPLEPTKLHYEYEQVYAGVTKATAKSVVRTATFSTRSLPSGRIDPSSLPEGATFDEAAQVIRVAAPTQSLFDALLSLSPDAPFWKAINELHKTTNQPLWGGFSSVELAIMPEGVTIPENLSPTLRFDVSLGLITAYQAITKDVRDQLIRRTPTADWYNEITREQGLSQKSTALFIGGGGYIFPRWFLKEFPGSENIEVAELDPAVFDVVKKELGMTEEEQKRIKTTLGDARNFVDDRVRNNQQLKSGGKAPVLYNFIYGDAFNDFSIPSHLTTIEFLKDVNDLLTDDGIFQANIIDMYPRHEYPGEFVGNAEVEYRGRLPVGLEKFSFPPGEFVVLGRAFAPLEMKKIGTRSFLIRTKRGLTLAEKSRLSSVRFSETSDPARVDSDDFDYGDSEPNWSNAVSQLADFSRKPKYFEGRIPERLGSNVTALDSWTPSQAPFESVELKRLDGEHYVLGFRGILSPELKQQLIDIDPQNAPWVKCISTVAQRSKGAGAGRFLGRYVATAAKVFPNLYIFSTSSQQPGSDRDTFVMVCSRRPIDLTNLASTGEWTGMPFASLETPSAGSAPVLKGQMAAVLALAEGFVLTDDFAPVDNLLRPVFADQE